MTMFNRTPEKPGDAGAPMQAAPSAAPPPVETKRPQAIVQPPASGAAPSVSVISKALKITGQLESTEDIQIEGEIEGDVRAISVSVGPNARIKGTVRGDQVQVSGAVDGRIEAKKVVLTRTARMSGDVVHQDITIESGAFIDGHCKPEFGKSEAKGGPKPIVAAANG